jgi:LmbE family N-acetylglucosaminyl deacetylase/CheY-like chemotaxis protein
MGAREDTTRILLVEDNRVIAEVMQRLLRDVGDVTWVADGEAALGQLGIADWNLLITDIELPGMDGLELLRAARSREPSPAALVVSGHEKFEYAVEAIRAGATDYITKPVEPEDLLAKVRHGVAVDRANRSKRNGPSQRVLAIGAHPDDVELGCGGVLLGHQDAGDSITVLTLSGGEAGGEASVRVVESQRAAGMLSARLYLLNLDDTAISEAAVTIAAISEVIEEAKPTTIYTHTSRDVHQDHRSTHHATLVAARTVPRLYAYQSPSTTVDFRPTRFISIDDVLERKLGLIGAYESQTKIRGYLAPDMLRATARYWSRFGSASYAEPLEVVREGDIVSRAIAATASGEARSAEATYAGQ